MERGDDNKEKERDTPLSFAHYFEAEEEADKEEEKEKRVEGGLEGLSTLEICGELSAIVRAVGPLSGVGFGRSTWRNGHGTHQRSGARRAPPALR